METAGNFITAIAKFTTGMENSHNDFNSRFTCLMHIHRNTTAVINYGNAIIFMNEVTSI
jgi:hypothetical protein